MPKAKELITIEVGKDKEIDEGFEGSIQKLKIKRVEGFKKAQQFQKLAEKDPLEGMLLLLKELETIYPKVNLSYGEHKFSSIEDLYETDVGEKLITEVLLPKVAGATQIAKN